MEHICPCAGNWGVAMLVPKGTVVITLSFTYPHPGVALYLPITSVFKILHSFLPSSLPSLTKAKKGKTVKAFLTNSGSDRVLDVSFLIKHIKKESATLILKKKYVSYESVPQAPQMQCISYLLPCYTLPQNLVA